MKFHFDVPCWRSFNLLDWTLVSVFNLATCVLQFWEIFWYYFLITSFWSPTSFIFFILNFYNDSLDWSTSFLIFPVFLCLFVSCIVFQHCISNFYWIFISSIIFLISYSLNIFPPASCFCPMDSIFSFLSEGISYFSNICCCFLVPFIVFIFLTSFFCLFFRLEACFTCVLNIVCPFMYSGEALKWGWKRCVHELGLLTGLTVRQGFLILTLLTFGAWTFFVVGPVCRLSDV